MNIDANRTGDQRIVTCYLRGSRDPYPLRLRQGRLLLSGDQATWKPFWNFRCRAFPINMKIGAVHTRLAGRKESDISRRVEEEPPGSVCFLCPSSPS